ASLPRNRSFAHSSIAAEMPAADTLARVLPQPRQTRSLRATAWLNYGTARQIRNRPESAGRWPQAAQRMSGGQNGATRRDNEELTFSRSPQPCFYRSVWPDRALHRPG